MNSTRYLAEELEHTGARFIVAELDLAITFCQIGLTARAASRVVRNVDNAKRALETVSEMKRRIRVNPVEAKEIREKTAVLQSLLDQLKDHLASFR